MHGTITHLIVFNPNGVEFDCQKLYQFLHDMGHRDIRPYMGYLIPEHERGCLVVWQFVDRCAKVSEAIIHNTVAPGECVEYRCWCPRCGSIKTNMVYPKDPSRNRIFVCDCPEKDVSS